jgi:methylase of polypeptide subunit release factors
LLILDGERLSYRTLDVEQIGSVYEAIMGFELQVSAGKSIAIRPVKSHGAPATINLEALLAAKPSDRAKLLNEWTDQKLGTGDAAAIKDATSIDELVAALDKKIAKHVTPGIVPADSMVFQPSDERRRSGSHYTPRSLTQPIVKTTLEPILKQLITHPEELNPRDTQASSSDVGSSSLGLGATVVQPRPLAKELQKRLTKGEIAERERAEERRAAHHTAAIEKGVPHPSQILDLKVCDPAMGSGAFLVEACRQLGDELIKAWYAHDMIPADIPPDEDEVLYARRTVAQRCLYGVDKNIMAVDLAKLSLWLVTLAKDHPFTFLDHSLRHGDSLVGLTREQIIGFHWEPKKQMKFGEDLIQKRLDRATEARAKILSAREDVAYRDQEQRMAVADEALDLIRLVGDACVSCFFAADKTKARERDLERVFGLASSYFSSLSPNNQSQTTTVDFQSRAALQAAADRLKSAPHPIPCFHWEIEFPEVFSRENGGFDAFVGNPPFLGGKRITGAMGTQMKEWLAVLHHDSSGNADLVSHFFRRTFINARTQGTIGLIATNTIGQGDTRRSGLRWICHQGGEIYSAVRRLKWPGVAAVVVSVIQIEKGEPSIKRILDGKPVSFISAFLFHQGSHEDPNVLIANNGLSFVGCDIKGQGFLFDDTDSDANPVSLMHELVQKDASNQKCIKPYLGGSELNGSPTLSPIRWVIHFGDRSLEEAKHWTELIEIVEEKVKAERATKKGGLAEWPWWQFWRVRRELYEACIGKERVIACAQTSRALAFSFLSPEIIFSHKTIVLTIDDFARYGVLQSRVHVEWAYFFGSTMKDDPVYTPSDCFETFPFPQPVTTEIAAVAEQYYTARNQIMRSRDLGITDTLNLFDTQQCGDEDILELRRLHGEMDLKVLRAYGWYDLADQAAQPDFCQFLLDYEEDEDDSESDSGSTRQKKKPWRYRWPDDFRDEVLARLLELNEQRHQEELLLVKGKSTERKPVKKTNKKPAKASATPLLDGLDLVELSRDERLILLIVDSFKRITRTAVDQAFIAMKYPKLRKSRLGLGEPPRSVPRTDPGRDTLIGGLVDKGFLEKHPSDYQQIWKLGSNAPSLAPTAAERQALEETQAIFQKSIDTGDTLASCTEGVTDAKPGLVSIA